MPLPEDLPVSLAESAYETGHDLTLPNQTIAGATIHLNGNLAVLGCEEAVDETEIKGTWDSNALRMYTPPFTRLLQAATASLIFRRGSLADIALPEGASSAPELSTEYTKIAKVDPSTVDLAEIIRNTGEGATWIDPAASKERTATADQNAFLLRQVLTGLRDGGYSEQSAKTEMREVFDEILDDLWRRGSYHLFAEPRVVTRIMSQAGIRTLTSRANAVRRFAGFARDYGVGLAIIRLLPEKYLIELE